MSPRTHPGRQEPEPRAQGLRQPQGVGKLAGGVCRGPLTGHGPPGQSVVSAWCMSPPRGPPRGPRPGCSQERAGGPSFMSAVQRAASRVHRQPPLEAVSSACRQPASLGTSVGLVFLEPQLLGFGAGSWGVACRSLDPRAGPATH